MNYCLSLAVSLFLLALAATVTGNESAYVSLTKEQKKLDCSNSKVLCQSVPNAFACNSLDHCTKAIWSKQKTIQSTSESICQECIDLMEMLKSQLHPNDSKVFVEKVMDALCWSLMDVKPVCEIVLHVSFDKIYDMLNASVQNEKICNSLPFCVSNAESDHMHIEHDKQVKNSCTKCFDFIESSNIHFVSKSIDMKRSFFARFIPKLCVLTFGNQDFCFSQNFSTEQFDIMSTFVEKNLLNKELCRFTSLCLDTSNQLVHLSQTVDEKSSPECDMCKIIFRNVQQLLVTNSSFEKFKTNMENLCSKLVKNSEICNKDLDKYLNFVYNTMKEPSFPDLACTIMDVCITDAYPNPYIISSIHKNTESKPEQELVTRNEIDFGDPIEITDEEQMRKLYRCHFLAFIRERIESGRDNEGIKDDFALQCGKIESFEQSRNCKYFYEKELDHIIDLISLNHIVTKPCMETALPFLAHNDSKNAENSKEDCIVCHLLMSKFKKMLSKNKTIQEIETYIKKVCMVVEEEKLREECDNFVDTYGTKLIQLLNDDFSPKYICKELKICDSQTIDELRQKVDDCGVCTQSTKALSQHMSDRMFNVSDATQLMAVCNDVPQKNLLNQCRKMMKTFGKSFVVLMQENLSPVEVCYRTGLCANNVIQCPSECFSNINYAFQSVKNALQCNSIAQFLIHHEIFV